MKTANYAVQNKSFGSNPNGLLRNLGNDTSCVKQALIFLSTFVVIVTLSKFNQFSLVAAWIDGSLISTFPIYLTASNMQV